MGLKILKTGSFLPESIIENSYFEKYLDTSDEWIKKRTGIEKRRISKDIDVCDLSKKAVEDLNLSDEEKSKIKLVIVSSLSADYIMPSISSNICGHLNLHKEILAFDLNMACTGFVGASILAEKYLEKDEYAIVVGTEVLSKYMDFNNRENAILFGDGSGAVLYKKIVDNFSCDSGTLYSKDLSLIGKSLDKESSFIEMNGKNVYRFTMEYVPESIRKTIEMSSYSEDEIDYFVLHQANMRIIKGIAKRFGGIEKYFTNLNKFGNTSSATIPICLDEMNKKNLLKENQKLLLSGFGGGLNYSTCIVLSGGK